MSKLNASTLLRKKPFRYITGVSPARLRPSWKRRGRRKERSGRPYGVGGLEDHLLVLLIIYRCHITQDFLACLFGVGKVTICRSLRRILGVKKASV